MCLSHAPHHQMTMTGGKDDHEVSPGFGKEINLQQKQEAILVHPHQEGQARVTLTVAVAASTRKRSMERDNMRYDQV